MNDPLAGLNEAQKAAASHLEGPALVLAGAGSGKTRTVTHRIAFLLQQGIETNQILAVTFTNKAASEMKERIEKLIGPADGLWVSTFHSLGVKILRTYGARIGLNQGFVIYDDSDQLDIIKDILSDIPGSKNTNPRAVRSVIDRAKCDLLGPNDLQNEFLAGLPADIVGEIYNTYENRLRQANAVDFGDLLTLNVRLFQEANDVLERVQNRAVFIHVDEYQDTNHAQYQLVKLLASKNRNLLVVGDPDQSIYRFRGADIANILAFQNDYPDAQVYKLESNYRSSGHILTVANNLIKKNSERLEKILKPVKDLGEPVRLHKSQDHRTEAEFVVNRIESLRNRMDLDKIAVLYRTNAQSRVLEERFLRAGIPVKIFGATAFYDRQEIKDVLALAKLAVNPNDEVSLRRALKRPKRGLGEVTINKLITQARENNETLVAGFGKATGYRAQDAINFSQMIDILAEKSKELPAKNFLQLAISSSGYVDMLKTEGIEGQQRLENLEELLVAANEWDEENEGTIKDYLDETALLGGADTSRNSDGEKIAAVNLMTIHNAKGLEFAEVFIVGLEEGLLPHRSSLIEAGGIEEERRLFYVAITRAMEGLTMSLAESRQTYGETSYSQPSRFLRELPNEFIINVNSFYQSSQTKEIPKLEAPTASLNLSLRGGERVRHPKFGEGKVVAIAGSGDRQEAMISFPSGTKKLLVKYANLRLIS